MTSDRRSILACVCVCVHSKVQCRAASVSQRQRECGYILYVKLVLPMMPTASCYIFVNCMIHEQRADEFCARCDLKLLLMAFKDVNLKVHKSVEKIGCKGLPKSTDKRLHLI